MRVRSVCVVFSCFCTVACCFAACSDPPPVIVEGEGEEGEGEGEGEVTCTPVEVGPIHFDFRDDVSTHYSWPVTTALDGNAADFLVLQLFNYNERIGDLGAGTFALDDATNDNYGHCAECVLVFSDQIDPNSTPRRTFFQSAGTITVEENPREQSDIKGSIDGLVVVESTIGGEALESAPVPGGACLAFSTISFDFHFVPDGWTCDAAAYNADDGVCDCNCGGVDEDCFPDVFGEEVDVTGCDNDDVCVFDACAARCDVDAGVGCGAGELCVLDAPTDHCADTSQEDPAALGDNCGDDFGRFYCAVDNTLPGGICDLDLDGDNIRVCKAFCSSAADCGPEQFCFTIVGGSDDGTGRGYCEDGEAP